VIRDCEFVSLGCFKSQGKFCFSSGVVDLNLHFEFYSEIWHNLIDFVST